MALSKNVDSSRTISNIKSVDSDNNIILINTSSNHNIVDEFYFEPGNEKAVNSFIKNVERLVRTSNEYRNYISYLTNQQDLKTDVIMANLDITKVDLEFHHYPFTLYDIVDIMLECSLGENEKVTSINLAEKVLNEHYLNRVGLARLTKTNHELAHAGSIFVPLSSVFGDVNGFILRYRDYISFELMEKYNTLVDIQKNQEYDNTTIFKKK